MSAHDITAQIKPKEYKITNSIHFSPKDLKYEDKNAAYAGVISLIVPGLALGQIYNDQYGKFAIHTFISITCISAFLLMSPSLKFDIAEGENTSGPWGLAALVGLTYLGNWIYSIVDSVVSANKINARNRYLNNALSGVNKFEIGFATNEQKKLQVKLKLNL